MTAKSPGTAVITAKASTGTAGKSTVKVGYKGDLLAAYAELFKDKKGREMYDIMKIGRGVDWCALFASYCYDMNGALGQGKIVDQYAWNVDHFLTLPNYRSKANYPKYVPKPGDLVIFAYPGSSNPKHVGIVKRYYVINGKSYLDTIEGNVGSTYVYDSEVDYRNKCRTFTMVCR